MSSERKLIEAVIIDLRRIPAKMGRGAIQYYVWYLILGEKNGNKRLPIVIGDAEAVSILIALDKKQSFPRPLSHDLAFLIFKELGIKIIYCSVVDIKENTFYGEICLEFNGKKYVFDARPSDAIAFAVRANCPIFIADNVLEEAGIKSEDLEKAEEETEENQEITSQATTKTPSKTHKSLEDMSLEELKKELQKAVSEENYELAAKIRDLIKAKESGEEGKSENK